MDKKNYCKFNLNNVEKDGSIRPEEKGITLIALIITIIVILILVAVSVRTISQSKLFDHAKNATNKWAEKQEEESNINIDSYVDEYTTDYSKYYNDPNVKPTNTNYFTWAIDDEEEKTAILTGIKDEYAVRWIYTSGSGATTHYNVVIKDGNKKITDVIIPAEVRIDGEKYKVIGIEREAFIGRNTSTMGYGDAIASEFTSFILPNTIQFIGREAFSDCDKVTKISIPKSVTNVGYGAFGGWGRGKTINCEVNEKPADWDNLWIYSYQGAQVNWGVEM